MSENRGFGVVKLEPSKVASFRAIGKHPEEDAYAVLVDWARKQGLLEKEGNRFFGFDNPGPSPERPYYGYEVWMTVPGDAKPSGYITIKDFPGGHYAVLTTQLSRIGEDWRKLVKLVRASEHVESCQQCLEEALTMPAITSPENVRLDLLLPIEPI